MPKRYGQACPVAKSLEVVGDRWTLLLVRDLLRGPRRFQDLQESLAGIPPNILSDRLKLMEEHALVARRFYSDHPPRAEYALTGKGRELGVVVGALAAWGSRHLHRQTALVHAECGHPVEITYFCARCAAGVRGATVELRRRPTSGGPGRAASAGGSARGARPARRAPRG
ncbi:MAG TPA: helix-turn-helix domain-containing protein [Gemmatimonadales bacterium]|nr:helix-turn-helix domain-containing protein [Gemmatimonadales bacterium]